MYQRVNKFNKGKTMAIFTAIATGAAAIATFVASTVTVSSLITPSLGSCGMYVKSDVNP